MVRRDSDVKVWALLALGLVTALLFVIGFFWYLDSVGTADGPNEGGGGPSPVIADD